MDDLTRDLIRAENAQILNGSGIAPNLRGVLQTTGIQTRARGTDSNLDALPKAVTMLQTTAFLQPTHLLLNPSNFETIRLSKSADGEYLLGDPLTQGQPSLMGANIVLTTDVPAGTGVLMNANEAARVYVRKNVRVDFASNHADYFARNHIRAEARLALAVRRPAAIATVTGLV